MRGRKQKAGPEACSAAAVQDACRRAGLAADGKQSEALAGYLSLLMKWNRAMNLVGASDWRDALENLVADSFYLAEFLEAHAPADPVIWDLGAGAGLPGIPLRILWQKGSWWLVESREKRALFLATFLARHPLPGTYAFRGRAEDFMRGRMADVIVSRAFLPMEKMLPFAGGSLKPGGLVIFLRNEPAAFPQPWKDGGMLQYAVRGEQRFICAAQKP